MVSLKRRSLWLSEKYRAITEMESRTKPLDLAKRDGISRNTISTWLLPGKIKSAFQSDEVSTKRENVTVGQNKNLEKALLDWFKRMRMNNLPVSGTILKEKAISYAQELKAGEFHASNGWFEKWKARFYVSFKTITEEEKVVTAEMTSSWWKTHLSTVLSQFELKDIYNATICNM